MTYELTWCPVCTRLIDNYNATVSRGDGYGALAALEEFDLHRDDRTVHGPGGHPTKARG